MKTVMMIALLSLSFASMAKTTFVCKTNNDDYATYYVKETMVIEFTKKNEVFAKMFDKSGDVWTEGSVGYLKSINETTGSHMFNKFSSIKLFGDLSEGLANEGINLYVSKEIIIKKPVKDTLYASGSEAGKEKATYNCILK